MSSDPTLKIDTSRRGGPGMCDEQISLNANGRTRGIAGGDRRVRADASVSV